MTNDFALALSSRPFFCSFVNTSFGSAGEKTSISVIFVFLS